MYSKFLQTPSPSSNSDLEFISGDEQEGHSLNSSFNITPPPTNEPTVVTEGGLVILSWNVASLEVRKHQLLALLHEKNYDVILLQETLYSYEHNRNDNHKFNIPGYKKYITPYNRTDGDIINRR